MICPICGEETECEVALPGFGGEPIRFVAHVMCQCELEAEEKRRKKEEYKRDMEIVGRIKNASLLDAKLKNVSFQTFSKNEGNEKAFRIAKGYVDSFEKYFDEGQGILFYGDVGTGKSYTAAMIANELMNRKQSVLMTSFIKILSEKNGFSGGELLERLNRPRLLIVDDLGAERSTDYALEIVYAVIDGRYRTGKPVILTTNVDIREMKSCQDIRLTRIYDRVFEMCYPVKVDGVAFRKKAAVTRFSQMKSELG